MVIGCEYIHPSVLVVELRRVHYLTFSLQRLRGKPHLSQAITRTCSSNPSLAVLTAAYGEVQTVLLCVSPHISPEEI